MEENGHISTDLFHRGIDLKGDLSLTAKEKSLWRQRCKAKWLTEDDVNSTLFHRFVAAKKRRNTIIEVVDQEG